MIFVSHLSGVSSVVLQAAFNEISRSRQWENKIIINTDASLTGMGLGEGFGGGLEGGDWKGAFVIGTDLLSSTVVRQLSS